MLALIIALVLIGWGLVAVSLYLVWIVRVSSFTLLLPMTMLPLAWMLWGFTTLYSLLQLIRIARWNEEFGVYLINAGLGGVPLLHYVYLFLVYPGPRSQFVLDYVLTPHL